MLGRLGRRGELVLDPQIAGQLDRLGHVREEAVRTAVDQVAVHAVAARGAAGLFLAFEDRQAGVRQRLADPERGRQAGHAAAHDHDPQRVFGAHTVLENTGPSPRLARRWASNTIATLRGNNRPSGSASIASPDSRTSPSGTNSRRRVAISSAK